MAKANIKQPENGDVDNEKKQRMSESEKKDTNVEIQLEVKHICMPHWYRISYISCFVVEILYQ